MFFLKKGCQALEANDAIGCMPANSLIGRCFKVASEIVCLLKGTHTVSKK